jgi:hypothetical protein
MPVLSNERESQLLESGSSNVPMRGSSGSIEIQNYKQQLDLKQRLDSIRVEQSSAFKQNNNNTVGGTETSNQDRSISENSLLRRSPIVQVRRSEPTEFFEVRQKWEGYVQSVDEETFSAVLTAIQGDEGEQQAEIYLENIDEVDRKLIEPGAIFYWSVGYLDRPSGRQRASVIRFRRLPAWTRADIEEAQAEAEELSSMFDE